MPFLKLPFKFGREEETKEYGALLSDEHDEENSPSPFSRPEKSRSKPYASSKFRPSPFLLTVVISNILLFCSSLGLALWSTHGSLWGGKGRNQVWRNANAYYEAPIIDEIEIPMETRRMKGTLLDYDHDIYRQPPSPKVDAAWDDLSEHGISFVTGDQALEMGWDTDVVPLFPPELDVGPDKYAGEIDAIHKIHCLNMVRKDVYFDYYWKDMYPDGNPSERHSIHTNHCIYILLQALICDANTDIIPHVYLDDYQYPVPDFQINRKCGNFEGVREWNRAHSVPFNETSAKLLEKPPGHKARPMNDEFRRIFEVDTP